MRLLLLLLLSSAGSTSGAARYVDANSASPAPPYTNWATAARVIQDAVDAAVPGDEIIVTNGVYATGGRAVGRKLLVNRVAVEKPLSLRSVNGPQVTIIWGFRLPGTTNGDGAVRCVYLANGASLSGFTLTNGATRSVEGWSGLHDPSPDSGGGGAWAESTSAVLSNCVVVGNSAHASGGGMWSGTLRNCEILGNWAGASGGGAAKATLRNCTLRSNSAYAGGGAWNGTLDNCLLVGNTAFSGGGALGDFFELSLNNCTLVGNSARYGGGISAGDYGSAFLTNCIIYSNAASLGANYDETTQCMLSYCCTTPQPESGPFILQGVGNMTNAPLFVDAAAGNYRLRSDSPCINAGCNAYALGPTDLDGMPRIANGTVDIGAYEFQRPAPGLPVITKATNYNASVSLGASVKMQVWATGSAPVSWQWWFGGLALADRTNAILNLTNVSASDAGPYTLVVSNTAGSASTNLSLEVDSTFTTITAGAYITHLAHEHGQACGDYDHDGYPDILVWNVPLNKFPLYGYNQDGTSPRVLPPGLQGGPSLFSYFVGWVDYDNDGELDVFAANTSGGGKNFLGHNNGDGTFTRITNAPVATEGTVTAAGVWGDYDRDGDLDLFVPNGAPGGVPSRNWLYQNQGDGSFLKLTNILTTDLGLFGASSWVDVDGDGWQDLFVSVYLGTNRLYLNTRDGGFVRVTGDPLVREAAYWGPGPAWADYDNNGSLDVFLTTFGVNYVGPVALYRNNGTGQFTKMTTNDVGSLVAERGNMSAATWGDYDNDGWLDLFVVSARDETEKGKCWLYHNRGDGTFAKVSSGSPANEMVGASTANWLDIDRDGFLDVLIAENDHTGRTPNHLYRNNGNANNWLCVECVGTASPRWGTGAKVFLTATIRGTRLRQLRLIDPGGSAGNHGLPAHFGLGDAIKAELLRIEWASGTIQEFRNVPADQYLTVTEPAKLAMTRPGELQIRCWKGMVYQIESSADLASWTRLATVTNLNLTGGIRWADPDASGRSARFYRAVKQ